MEKLRILINDYIQTRIDILKVEIQESIIKILVSIIFLIITIICFFFFILFASIIISKIINNLTSSDHLGYLTISLLYLFFGLLLFNTKIKQRLLKKISILISKSFNE